MFVKINFKKFINLILIINLALVIAAGLLSFQQLSGINVVLFYSQSIFEKAGSSMDPAISTIIVGE